MQTYHPLVLTRGVKALFMSAYAATKRLGLRELLATTVKSDGASESYAWIGPPPQLEELDGSDEIIFEPMQDGSYSLANLKFAKGIAVSRDQLDDDQLGAVRMRIMQLADVAAHHPDALMTTAIINGTSGTLGLGYDGVAFFSDSHPARGSSGVQDNLLAGSGITAATINDDLNTAVATLSGFLNENAEPYHSMLTDYVIVAPPRLRGPIQTALGAGIIANTSNVSLTGIGFQVVINPRLVDTTDWYLFHVGGAVKPFVFQDRRALEFDALERESDTGFIREQYLYKASARYNVGYANWQNAVKVVNA